MQSLTDFEVLSSSTEIIHFIDLLTCDSCHSLTDVFVMNYANDVNSFGLGDHSVTIKTTSTSHLAFKVLGTSGSAVNFPR